MNTPVKPTKKYSFRIPLGELEQARSVARAHGIPLTELIRLRLRNLSVPDRSGQQLRFESLHALTQELQYIGHNINQVTTAIHRANIRQYSIEADLRAFNQLLDSYLSSRERLRVLMEQFLQP